MKIIGKSIVINKVNKLIKQVANANANVLILGDSGTGKELVARNIHDQSSRAKSPFVPINCAAIPAELLESELFGHEKGSFTGAFSARAGRFELAAHGSIFLDEIGDMPLTMQVKLLRVLQEHTFEKIGGNKTLKTNARIIAATNKNLEELVNQGKFREDLFYRLNVFPIFLPALRERKEDVRLLIDYYLQEFSSQLQICTFSAQAIDELSQYNWPGNIRELMNMIERLCILYPGKQVTKEMLPDKLKDKLKTKLKNHVSELSQQIIVSTKSFQDNFNLKDHIDNLEVSYINEALLQSNGVVSRAAIKLGLRRTTLVEKMKKHKIIENKVVKK